MSAIRPATAADVPRVWELIKELAEFEKLTHTVTGTEAQLRESLFGASPVCQCRVIEVDDQVVGYAITFTTYSTFRTLRGLWLEDLYVTPAHRGTGLGKALLHSVIEDGRSQGVGRIEWSVLDWNTSAIEFYERMGAQVLPDWRFSRVSLGI